MEIEEKTQRQEELDNQDPVLVQNVLFEQPVEVKNTKGFIQNGLVTRINAYLNTNTRFADTKAGAIVTFNGFVFTYAIDFFSKSHSFAKWLGLVIIICLAISIFYALLVVAPKFREKEKEKKGIIYWGNIAKYDTPEEYIETVKQMETSKFADEWLNNNYHQAKILTGKFERLAMSFLFTKIAYIVLALAMILNVIF